MLVLSPLIQRCAPPPPVVTLQENIPNPFRTGKVTVSVGKTTYENLTQAFIMLDKLDWLFRLKPSFVMLFPSEKALREDGDKTNTTIIYPKVADTEMDFNILTEGKAHLTTYFFGEPKKGRTFDLYFRFFEIGFRLTDFTGLEKSIFRFYEGTEISISSETYKHPTIITGNTGDEFKCRARVTRKN